MLRFARWWLVGRLLARAAHRVTKPGPRLQVSVLALNLAQCLAAVVYLSVTAGAAFGESYPNRPITLVATAAPGGVTDILARVLGQRLSKSWGQQVIVENKPGASNQIGAEFVAKSAPDGYTLLVSPEATFVVNPWLYSKQPYDPAKDFTPITGLVSISQSLVANPGLPVQNLQELIALAKQRPGELNYGTFGVGSTGHLNMEMLQSMAGVKLVAVHYKGATPALTDVMAGHIQMMFISTSSAIEPWKAGKLKLVAVGSLQRLTRLPEIPTAAESGLAGFEAVSWFGLFAPAGTPRAVVELLNAEVRRVFQDPEFQEKFLAPNMFEPMVSSPEQFSSFIQSQAQKWGDVVRKAKVKID
jgi:tripartite-type tricarboxylate transporter receptor subunit TctC